MKNILILINDIPPSILIRLHNDLISINKTDFKITDKIRSYVENEYKWGVKYLEIKDK